jgi:ParB family transcriptional regulator, chromosome partitioning protein
MTQTTSTEVNPEDVTPEVVEFNLIQSCEVSFAISAIAQGYEVEELTEYAPGRTTYIVRAYRVEVQYVHPNTWNPNEVTDQEQDAIGESLDKRGQFQELVCRPSRMEEGAFEILDGEHRYKHLSEIPGRIVAINVLLNLTDAEAQQITAIADLTRGNFNKIKFAKMLKEIQKELNDDTGVGLPYTDNELDEIIKLADVDWDSFDKNEEEEGNTGQQSIWVDFKAKIPTDAVDVVNQAYERISKEAPFHKDKSIAFGQFVERLCAEFLAG